MFFYSLCVQGWAQPAIGGTQTVNDGELDAYYLYDSDGNQTSVCGSGTSTWSATYSDGTSAAISVYNSSPFSVTWANTACGGRSATVTFNGFIMESGGCAGTGTLTLPITLTGASIAGNSTPSSLSGTYSYSLLDNTGSGAALCNGSTGSWSVIGNQYASGKVTTSNGNSATIDFANKSSSVQTVTVQFVGDISLNSTCKACTVSYTVTVPTTSGGSGGTTNPGSGSNNNCSTYKPTGHAYICEGGGNVEIGKTTTIGVTAIGPGAYNNAAAKYYWQSSTVSATDGFGDISGGFTNGGGSGGPDTYGSAYWYVTPGQCGITYYRLRVAYYLSGIALGAPKGADYSNVVAVIPYYPNDVWAACGTYSGLTDVGANTSLAAAGSSCASGVTLPSGTTTIMKSGNNISLLPGFSAQPGSYLYAEILTPCANGQNFREEAPKTAMDSLTASSVTNEITLYPNPTTGVVNIDFNYSQSKRLVVQVFNILGGQVYSKELGEQQVGQTTVDLSNQADGLYIVKVTADGEVTTEKIVLAD